MSRKPLPLIDTEVSERRSIAEILDLLQECGFDEVIQHTKEGQYTVAAKYKGAVFQFTVRPQDIVDAVLKSKGDRTKSRMQYNGAFKRDQVNKAQSQAARVGWRVIHLNVKALHDSILLGVLTVAQAFGGYLMIRIDGEDRSFAGYITEQIETGKLDSSRLLPSPERKS